MKLSDVTVIIPTLFREGLHRAVYSLQEEGAGAVLLIGGHCLALQRNRGARMADTELIVYMDDDCVAQPGFLERGLRFFESNDLDFMQGAVTGGITTSPEFVYVGAHIWMRRQLVLEHRFNEGFFVFEDLEFCWRMIRLKKRFAYCPGSVVEHPSQPGHRTWASQRIRQNCSERLKAVYPEEHAALTAKGWDPAG